MARIATRSYHDPVNMLVTGGSLSIHRIGPFHHDNLFARRFTSKSP